MKKFRPKISQIYCTISSRFEGKSSWIFRIFVINNC